MIDVRFELADIPDELDIKEGPGRVVYRIGRHLNPEQIVAALNWGARAVLDGGHWFQEWHGDIITNGSQPASTTKEVQRPCPDLHDVNRPESAA